MDILSFEENAKRPAFRYRMPFGPFQGMLLAAVPIGYSRWLLSSPVQVQRLKEALRREQGWQARPHAVSCP